MNKEKYMERIQADRKAVWENIRRAKIAMGKAEERGDRQTMNELQAVLGMLEILLDLLDAMEKDVEEVCGGAQ